MNKSTQLVGTGIALIVGSVLAIAPVAAAGERPARICVDNASAGQCESVVLQRRLPGGSGQEVVVRTAPAGRGDVKDHPDYGQITPVTPGRGDAKDHPNYGQITPVTPGRGDAKDHANYGSVSAPGGGGGVIPHTIHALRVL